MIPILFEKETHAFIGNGLARLYDAFECQVTEERNGVYELLMRYPVTGAHYNLITPGRIIVCTHDQTNTAEPFDIVSISRPIDGTITVHAVHISYRLTGVTVCGYDETVTTLEQAFNLFLAWAEPYNEFTFSSDIATEAYMASADGTPRTVRQLMGGIEGSILDTWGGEWSYHEFKVRLNRRRGHDRKFRIRYGFNMTEYNEDTDYSNTYTSCVPYWTGTDEDGAEVSIVGSRVNYTATSYNGHNICIPLDLTDKFETAPTPEQLESMAYAYMADNNADKPAQSIEVSFLQAQDMGLSDEYSQLLECELCDTVEVVFPYGDTNGRYKIVRTVWDVLADRYLEMTLGTLQTSLAEALGITNDLGGETDNAPVIAQINTLDNRVDILNDYAELYRAGFTAGTTAARVTGLTVSVSNGECFTKGTNQVTIKKSGAYYVSVSFVQSDTNNATNVKRVALYRNGSSLLGALTRGSSWNTCNADGIYTLNANDVMTMYARDESGTGTYSYGRCIIIPLNV